MQVTPWGGSATTTTYASDVVNEYTAVGGVSRTHDNNGNLKDDGSQKYVYDYMNRLCEVRDASNTLVASYKYDALGRRIEKDVVGGATTRYILAGVSIIEEYEGSDIWQASYMQDDRIDHPVAMERADIADVDGDSDTAEVMRFHYHQQALNSVTEITDPDGTVVEWTTYDAYGKATIYNQNGAAVAISAVGSPFQFTGREWDGESGLYFYRARTYDRDTGRFLQRDPLGESQGLNLFRYVRNSPTNFRDPSGLIDPDDPRFRSAGRADDQARSPEERERRQEREAVADAEREHKRDEARAEDLREKLKADVQRQGREGSRHYDFDTATGGWGWWREHKCNLWVADTLSRVGFLRPRVHGMGRIPTAAEWEDPETNIPGYPVVDEPQPGDVAAEDGHVGIVSEAPDAESGERGATVSHSDLQGRVVENDWGFRPERGSGPDGVPGAGAGPDIPASSPTFRRPRVPK